MVAAASVKFLDDRPQCGATVIDLDQSQDKDAVTAQIVECKRLTTESQALVFVAVDAGQHVVLDEIHSGSRPTVPVTPHGQRRHREG